jgi:hypothetical protein
MSSSLHKLKHIHAIYYLCGLLLLGGGPVFGATPLTVPTPLPVPTLSTPVPTPTPRNIPTDVFVFSESINMGGKTQKEESFIKESVSISNVVFEADVENHGLVSGATIAFGVTLSGGELTGTITNEGTINDVFFVGSKLSGGTLGGTIINENSRSEVGGIIKNVQLAGDAIIKGGKVGGDIIGERNDPALITAAQILMGSRLAHVRLSPTVQLPKNNIVLGKGVILPNDPPTAADFGLEPKDIAKLDAEKFGNLEIAVFRVFSASDIARIPSEAFAALEPAQIAKLKKEALAGMTKEQFERMPVETLSGLTADNMGGLPAEVLFELTPEHLDVLDVQEFKAMPNEDVSKLFVNFDADKITPQNTEKLVPYRWKMDLETGALTSPVGAQLTLQSLSPISLPINVKWPTLFNLKAGFGVGGRGTPLVESTQNALEKDNLDEFSLSQNDKGTFVVTGSGNTQGVKYTFIPDTNNTFQVNTDDVPIGVSVSAGGFYIVTTPNGIQYKVIPAPKDPVVLGDTLDNNNVAIGERGDVMVEMPITTRHGCGPQHVLIFEPFVEPAPREFCVERGTESFCNFQDAPEHLQPGLHLPTGDKRTRVCNFRNVREHLQPGLRLPTGDKRTRAGEKARLVYSDGTTQTVRPTVLSPDSFIKEAFKFEGVQRIIFNADGTFYVFYQGISLSVCPTFKVKSKHVRDDETIAPSITLNNQGGITYSILVDDEQTSSGGIRQVLIFDLLLEQAPKELCVESETGEIVCEFDNAPKAEDVQPEADFPLAIR